MKCPKCRSERISQERRIDGDAICMDCHHCGKMEEFRRKTNFDWITESPKALAKALVNIIDCATCPAECKEYKSQAKCYRDILQWLKQEKKRKGGKQE